MPSETQALPEVAWTRLRNRAWLPFRKYVKIFRVSLIERMAYRGDFLLGTILRFFPVITTILLWKAVFAGSEQKRVAGFSEHKMIAYLLLIHISRMFSSMPGLSGAIARDIREGTLKKYLIQPLDMIGYLLSYRAAHKVAYITTSAGPYAGLFLLCSGYFIGLWPDCTDPARLRGLVASGLRHRLLLRGVDGHGRLLVPRSDLAVVGGQYGELLRLRPDVPARHARPAVGHDPEMAALSVPGLLPRRRLPQRSPRAGRWSRVADGSWAGRWSSSCWRAGCSARVATLQRLRRLDPAWLVTSACSPLSPASASATEMAFRANFLVKIIVEVMWLGILLIFYWKLFENTTSIAGWSRSEYFFFVGCHYALAGVVETFFLTNCTEFAELVRSGDLDQYLLKPIDEQFLITCRWIDWSTLPNVLQGVGIMVAALAVMDWTFDPLRLALFLVLFACGCRPGLQLPVDVVMHGGVVGAQSEA